MQPAQWAHSRCTTGGKIGQSRISKSKCVIKNEAEYLWWWQICHRVEGGYDLHVRLVDSSSVVADLTRVRVEVNLLHQQEHLVFLLARTRNLQMMWNDSQVSLVKPVLTDLEWQLFSLTATIADGSDPMWKLKLVREEQQPLKTSAH